MRQPELTKNIDSRRIPPRLPKHISGLRHGLKLASPKFRRQWPIRTEERRRGQLHAATADEGRARVLGQIRVRGRALVIAQAVVPSRKSRVPSARPRTGFRTEDQHKILLATLEPKQMKKLELWINLPPGVIMAGRTTKPKKQQRTNQSQIGAALLTLTMRMYPRTHLTNGHLAKNAPRPQMKLLPQMMLVSVLVGSSRATTQIRVMLLIGVMGHQKVWHEYHRGASKAPRRWEVSDGNLRPQIPTWLRKRVKNTWSCLFQPNYGADSMPVISRI